MTQSIKEAPLVSIITPSLNRADMLRDALVSVLIQDYPNVEHIIIDGGSSDGTHLLLSEFPNLLIVSEPDRGMYDAINKGIQLASGQIIGILNSDDFYEPHIFSEVVDTFLDSPHVEAIIGGADIIVKEPGMNIKIIETLPTIPYENFWSRITIGLPIINAWFFRKTLFDRIGDFDLRYRYCSDRDFVLRFALNQAPYKSLNRTIYHYQQHPGSITMHDRYKGEDDFIFETRQLIENYLSSATLPDDKRKYLLHWHSDILSIQVIGALRNNRSLQAFQYANYGWNFNLAFPYLLIRRITYSLLRRLQSVIT